MHVHVALSAQTAKQKYVPEGPNSSQGCHGTLLVVRVFLDFLRLKVRWYHVVTHVMLSLNVTHVVSSSLLVVQEEHNDTSVTSCRLWRNASASCWQMAASHPILKIAVNLVRNEGGSDV
jgi:hypothetical protein